MDGVFTSSSSNANAATITDYCASISTTQINRISNRCGKFLDLVFSNEVLFSEVSSCEDFTGCSSIYHTPIMINIYFPVNCDITPFSNNFHYNFSNADFVSLNEYLINADWDFLQCNVNLNDTVIFFNSLLNTGIQRFVPLIKNKPCFREPWYIIESWLPLRFAAINFILCIGYMVWSIITLLMSLARSSRF